METKEPMRKANIIWGNANGPVGGWELFGTNEIKLINNAIVFAKNQIIIGRKAVTFAQITITDPVTGIKLQEIKL